MHNMGSWQQEAAVFTIVVFLQEWQDQFVLFVQEAYIRGVSGWNFDVAALKRSANDEGPGLERLSTIAETPGQ